jgi:hypothetical protein
MREGNNEITSQTTSCLFAAQSLAYTEWDFFQNLETNNFGGHHVIAICTPIML